MLIILNVGFKSYHREVREIILVHDNDSASKFIVSRGPRDNPSVTEFVYHKVDWSPIPIKVYIHSYATRMWPQDNSNRHFYL